MRWCTVCMYECRSELVCLSLYLRVPKRWCRVLMIRWIHKRSKGTRKKYVCIIVYEDSHHAVVVLGQKRLVPVVVVWLLSPVLECTHTCPLIPPKQIYIL